jgi:hypothetical protein
MSARTRREARMVGVAACIAAAAMLFVFRGVGVGHARETKIVGPLGEPLHGLFDGLSANPRYDPALAALMSPPPTSSDCRPALLERMLSYVERVVYAQGGRVPPRLAQANSGSIT